MLEYLRLRRGGFFKGTSLIKIDCLDGRLKLNYYISEKRNGNPRLLHTNDTWSKERSKLWLAKFEMIHFNLWSDSYCTDVLDGEQWKLTIKLGEQNERKISGSNAYPDDWNDFIKLISNIVQKLPPPKEIEEEIFMKELIAN